MFDLGQSISIIGPIQEILIIGQTHLDCRPRPTNLGRGPGLVILGRGPESIMDPV